MKRDRRQPEHRAFRQGTRKGDRWGLCKECGVPSAYRCDRCGNWRCFGSWSLAQHGIEHGRLRRVPGTVGRFIFYCVPRCRLRTRGSTPPDQL